MASKEGSESDRVERMLRDEILDGVRPPGSRLVERDLAQELGVSRVPVREALQALAGEGLVTLRPHTWAVVREFTDDDVADLLQVRGALEVLAFRLAAERVDEAGLAHLRSAVAREVEAARAQDAVLARRAAADFHEAVIEASDNALLVDLNHAMRSRMRWLLAQHDDLLALAREHEELCAAIAARDLDHLDALVQAHLIASGERQHARAAAGRTAQTSSSPSRTTT